MIKGRLFTIITVICLLACFLFWGIYTPMVVSLWKEFGVQERAFDWPHDLLPHLNWMWTAPLGILLTTILVLKDRIANSFAKTCINVATVLILCLIFMLWAWGLAPHRMIQEIGANNTANRTLMIRLQKGCAS